MKMHEYLMEYVRYFGSNRRFQVIAENREEAMKKGNEYIKEIHDDNIIPKTLRVVKKLKPSFGSTE